MSKKEVKVAKVKTVAKAEKKNVLISEAEVKNFVNSRICELILLNVASEKWDGKPLEEDRVYHILKLGGIRIYWIKDNRRSWKRAMKMLMACMKNGMTTPAILVDAKVVSDWGLSLIDPATLEDVPADKLDGAYCVMEGHGRFLAFLLALALQAKDDSVPFDYHFVYKHYETAEDFGKAYVSTNADMTRTTTKDRMAIAGARSDNPLVKSYLSKIKDDHVIPKSSYFWTVGRELTPKEVTMLTYGDEDAPKFDETLTETLGLLYECFKERFGVEGAQKIYRGVAAAKWCAVRINGADDKMATAMAISDKVANMGNEIYTAIITASTNKRKHVTKEEVIMSNLDKMMD